MPQISKNPLSKKIEKKVFEIFLETFSQIKTKEVASNLLSDLLTPTEKIMIAKRLSIAYMIHLGYEYRTISRVLKVSLGTIARIKKIYSKSQGGLKLIINKISLYDQINDSLTKMVEDVIGLQPPKGLDWTMWRKHRLLPKKKNDPF